MDLSEARGRLIQRFARIPRRTEKILTLPVAFRPPFPISLVEEFLRKGGGHENQDARESGSDHSNSATSFSVRVLVARAAKMEPDSSRHAEHFAN